MPSEKMSERPSSASPRSCSGDMYGYFPLTVPVRVLDEAPTALAIPKSRTLTTPSGVTSRFCGDTSRWTTLVTRPSGPIIEWAWWSPSQACTRMPTPSVRSRAPAARMRAPSDAPSRYSIARKYWPSMHPSS